MSGSESETEQLPVRSDVSSGSSGSAAGNTPEKLRSEASSEASLKAGSSKSDTEVAKQAKEEISHSSPKSRPPSAKKQRVVFVFKNDIETRKEVVLPANTTVQAVKEELAKSLKLHGVRNVRLVKNGRRMRSREMVVGRPAYKLKQENQSASVITVPSVPEEIVIEIGLDDSDSEIDEDEGREGLEECQSRISIIPIINKEKQKLEEVTVIQAMDAREYFGGYKNKKTGRVYYHATTQTVYKNAKLFSSRVPATVQNTRETQTLLPLIDEGINTVSEKCTQMVQGTVYIPETTDKILTARPYQPYDERKKTMTPEAAVRILQKAWKFFIKKKRLNEFYSSQAEHKAARQQFKGTSLAEFYKLQKSLLTTDSYPTTRGDFYNLYTELGEWKKGKVSKLKEIKAGFAYQVAVADLQKKEQEGLLAIEHHRVQARDESLSRQDIMFLEGTARSRVRRYPKGNVTVIDDLNIQRARAFKELFASYTRTDATKEERIEMLVSMKNFLDGFEAVDLTEPLIELLDREIDLITMGIEDKHLSILRKRFESLFINLAKNPEINPQAKYYKTTQRGTKKDQMYKCVHCGKIMYPAHMFMHLRMRRFSQCMSCAYMHTTATATTNLAPYKRLLNSLREAEQEKCCRSALPFLLQPMGMYFLVNVLWNGKSVISGSSYLPSLKVTRWLPNEEWSMWNMILLTELEAHKHERLEDPLRHYSHDFILNVMNRNIAARMHFYTVVDIDNQFRERKSIGILPKDHLLYVRPADEAFLPQNDIHPTLIPSEASFDRKAPVMEDACN